MISVKNECSAADLIDARCGMPRWQREVVIAALPEGHP
jgi:hypothetical protein